MDWTGSTYTGYRHTVQYSMYSQIQLIQYVCCPGRNLNLCKDKISGARWTHRAGSSNECIWGRKKLLCYIPCTLGCETKAARPDGRRPACLGPPSIALDGLKMDGLRSWNFTSPCPEEHLGLSMAALCAAGVRWRASVPARREGLALSGLLLVRLRLVSLRPLPYKQTDKKQP